VESDLARELNLRIYRLALGFDGDAIFWCECGHVTCRETEGRLPSHEFAEILGLKDAHLVATGHETPETELVRARNGYFIVRRLSAILPQFQIGRGGDDLEGRACPDPAPGITCPKECLAVQLGSD
jgi:hypothetical protein